MNRKERRQTSKNLGIMEYQRNLSRSKRFNLMSENILSGKKAQEEFKEKSRQQVNSQIEEKESKIVYEMAESIAKVKNIPLIDAMNEANSKFEKSRK